MFKQGISLKHATLCMGDTAMHVGTCNIKNKGNIYYNANDKKLEEHEYLLFFRNLNIK